MLSLVTCWWPEPYSHQHITARPSISQMGWDPTGSPRQDVSKHTIPDRNLTDTYGVISTCRPGLVLCRCFMTRSTLSSSCTLTNCCQSLSSSLQEVLPHQGCCATCCRQQATLIQEPPHPRAQIREVYPNHMPVPPHPRARIREGVKGVLKPCMCPLARGPRVFSKDLECRSCAARPVALPLATQKQLQNSVFFCVSKSLQSTATWYL